MSDDDFMQASDEEYDFEYEDEEEEESGDVDIENKYYNAKQTKTTDPEEAVEEVLGIPPLEKEKGEWGFKGLKQAIKLEFKLRLYQKVGGVPSDYPAAEPDARLTRSPRLSSTTRSFSPMSSPP